ncbi:hypothetical protein EIP91_009357 [Steccherinum ochraceum]|uniref:F-box domain-containing protein n=1 Tax=Steccherinum ochraceum TaxID=92696 RepID=A0A4V2MX69_9APHY|nr:hypothetical protein EIP91_009357 [Steccherinum ochraceum]
MKKLLDVLEGLNLVHILTVSAIFDTTPYLPDATLARILTHQRRDGTFLLSTLKILGIRRILFRDVICEYFDSPGPDDDECTEVEDASFIDGLHEALEVRHRAGHPIKLLSLDESSHKLLEQDLIRPSSAPASEGLVDYNFKSLDARIAQHYQVFISLKIKRNSLAPINRFPPEILAEVFRYCKDPLDSNIRLSKRPLSFRWIGITHVCHYWREVALDTSDLWSTIDLNNMADELREEFLARSKSAHLSIRANKTDTERGADVVLAALPLFGRARSIDLELTHVLHRALSASPDLPPSFPHLKRLVLLDRSIDPNPDDPVPDFLGQCPAPSLEVLSVSGISVPWRSIPTTLTELTVDETSNMPSASEFAGILGRLRHLQHLSLTDALASITPLPKAPKITSRVVLRQLQTLSITDRAEEGLDFLRRIVFSPSVGLNLEFARPREQQEQWSSFSRFDRLSSKIPIVPGVDRLLLTGTRIAFYRSDHPILPEARHDWSLSLSRGPYFNLTFDIWSAYSDYNLIPSVLGGLTSSGSSPFFGITHVVISQMIVPSPSYYLTGLFERLPDLETLEFKFYEAAMKYGVGNILKDALLVETSKVKRIVLRNVCFLERDHRKGRKPPDDAEVCCELVQLILRLISEEGAQGIEEVVVDKCPEARDIDIVELRKYVPRVTYTPHSYGSKYSDHSDHSDG